MIKNNIVYSLRGMGKNKVFTMLNLVGFTIGMATCTVLSLFLYKEYTVDTSFPGYKNIFRLVGEKSNGSQMDYNLADALKTTYPAFVRVVPVGIETFDFSLKRVQGDGFVRIQQVISTSNEFFGLFSMKLILGDPAKPFADLNSVVLTCSTAEKLFGTIDVLGEEVNLSDFFTLTVSAVVEELPGNSSLRPDLFLNCENEKLRMSVFCEGDQSTCYNPFAIYVQLNSGTDRVQLADQVNAAFPANKSKTTGIRFQSISDIYLDSKVVDNANSAGSRGWLFIFSSITLLILSLSVINYVNFTLSKQLSTLKQLGIRMINGASRNQQRAYYITEVSLFVLLSFLLAVVTTVLVLPYAERLLNATLDIRWMLTPVFGVSIALFLLAIIGIASMAPLYIISRFDVQKLLGKKELGRGTQRGKTYLTIFQLMVTIVLLVVLLLVQKQLHYVKTTDLGLDQEHLIFLELPFAKDNKQALKQQVNQVSFVESASLSSGIPGSIRLKFGISENRENGENHPDMLFHVIYADEDFLKTFHIELSEGRELLESDWKQACYINEEAYRQYGWDHLENRTFYQGREEGFKIIGKVKNFTTTSLHAAIAPTCIVYSDDQNFNSLSIRLKPGEVQEQLDKLRAVWKEVMGSEPFLVTFYDAYFDAMYRKEQQQSKAIATFSFIAILITSLGLLGQIVQAGIARRKEIGIRKVNGASIPEIMRLLVNDFLKWLAVAFLIAVPIAWYSADQWLMNFSYKTKLSWWVFVLVGLATLCFVLLTVGYQTYKTAATNPLESLKDE